MQTSPPDQIATGESNYEKYKKYFTNDKKDTVSMDSFYKLLVAEMSNQDPLEPTSNTEFISQLATFSSLQAQQDNFAMQKQNYANSLVGQTVSVAQDGKKELLTGVVEYVNFSGKDTMISVDGKEYSLNSVKRVHGFESIMSAGKEEPASTLDSYGAFASSILGKTITVQSRTADGELMLDSGTASSLEIQDGIVRVILNGLAYDVTDIVSVTDAVKVKGDEEEEEGPEAIVEVTKKPEQTEAAQPEEAKPDVPPIEDNEPDKVTAAENAGSQTLVERTDDYDIQDLEEPEDDKVIVNGVTEEAPANTQNENTAENPSGWIQTSEAEELRSLFGE